MDSDDSTERYISVITMALSGVVTLLTFIVISVVTYLAFAHGITFFAWHPPLMLLGVNIELLAIEHYPITFRILK